MQIIQGMIVKSNAGHDKERFYLVVRLENGFAYIVDGKRRKLARPKRKSVSHLSSTKRIVDISLYNTDRKLRRLLWEFNYPDQPVQN